MNWNKLVDPPCEEALATIKQVGLADILWIPVLPLNEMFEHV